MQIRTAACRFGGRLRATIVACLLVASLAGCVAGPASGGRAPLAPPSWRSAGLHQTEVVILVQIAMRARGIYLGPIDGVAGPVTTRSAAAFRGSAVQRASGPVDAALLDQLLSLADFTRPMAYLDGTLLACLRQGPGEVLFFRTNLGTTTCSILRGAPANSETVQLGMEFCRRSAPLLRSMIECSLIYDGRRLVDIPGFLAFANNLSPDVAMTMETYDGARGRSGSIDVILRSGPEFYDFSTFGQTRRPPPPVRQPIPLAVLPQNGNPFCDGVAARIGDHAFDYGVDCPDFGGFYRGTATLVGVASQGGLLVPVFEAKLFGPANSTVELTVRGSYHRF
jgi:hypothetical protein